MPSAQSIDKDEAFISANLMYEKVPSAKNSRWFFFFSLCGHGGLVIPVQLIGPNTCLLKLKWCERANNGGSNMLFVLEMTYLLRLQPERPQKIQ